MTIDTPRADGLTGSWREVSVTTSDGARLAAFVHEPTKRLATGAHRPTLVAGHGWTLTHRSWHKVANLLADDGRFRIVLWDQRGHGASTLEHGKAFTKDQSLERLADDIDEVIQALVPAHSPVVLTGHSLGGMATIMFAHRHHDVLTHRVRGVGLIATSPGDVAAVRVPGGTPLLKLADFLPIRPRRLVPAPLEEALAFGDYSNPTDAADVAAQTGSTRLSTTGAFYEVVRDLDLGPVLSKLDGVPVTVVVGAKDKLTPPAHADRIRRGISTAELEIIPGAGHVVLYEQPEKVASILLKLAQL